MIRVLFLTFFFLLQDPIPCSDDATFMISPGQNLNHVIEEISETSLSASGLEKVSPAEHSDRGMDTVTFQINKSKFFNIDTQDMLTGIELSYDSILYYLVCSPLYQSSFVTKDTIIRHIVIEDPSFRTQDGFGVGDTFLSIVSSLTVDEMQRNRFVSIAVKTRNATYFFPPTEEEKINQDSKVTLVSIPSLKIK